ncbi:MAG: ATP-binding protein, partial [Planctomycetota bacterium]
CNCTLQQIERYIGKVSGPLLDRIDIQVEVPAADYKELSSSTPGTSSETIRAEVLRARNHQRERFSGMRILYNSQMSSKLLREHCRLDKECINLMKNNVNEMGLSARAHDKILRVARTIADLEDEPQIKYDHLLEAINYRQLDRQIFH